MTSKNRKKLGIALFVISTLFWFMLFSLPFLPIKGKALVVTGTVCLIMGEVLFYLSVAVLGREVYLKYKDKFNPRNWFKSKGEGTVSSEPPASSEFNTEGTPKNAPQ